MSEPHLRLNDVYRHYGDGEFRIDVLSGASLEVKSGELVALVAPSGGGKSTLLHVAGLLERPQKGEVSVCGTSTRGLSERNRTQIRRDQIGYVYQFHHLLPEFTALENVVVPQMIAGKGRRSAEEHAMSLLELLGIAQRAEHRPAELSGGEQQRVAIARAAANNPSVILADEPTGNLDPETSEKVFAALSELIVERGAAALIATHNHDLARRAHRIVTISKGQIVPWAGA
jgi:lipoprotein-releasing system ATP-binding protein